eukprot:2606714-Prymnesium_polylepis.1
MTHDRTTTTARGHMPCHIAHAGARCGARVTVTNTQPGWRFPSCALLRPPRCCRSGPHSTDCSTVRSNLQVRRSHLGPSEANALRVALDVDGLVAEPQRVVAALVAREEGE